MERRARRAGRYLGQLRDLAHTPASPRVVEQRPLAWRQRLGSDLRSIGIHGPHRSRLAPRGASRRLESVTDQLACPAAPDAQSGTDHRERDALQPNRDRVGLPPRHRRSCRRSDRRQDLVARDGRGQVTFLVGSCERPLALGSLTLASCLHGDVRHDAAQPRVERRLRCGSVGGLRIREDRAHRRARHVVRVGWRESRLAGHALRQPRRRGQENVRRPSLLGSPERPPLPDRRHRPAPSSHLTPIRARRPIEAGSKGSRQSLRAHAGSLVDSRLSRRVERATGPASASGIGAKRTVSLATIREDRASCD